MMVVVGGLKLSAVKGRYIVIYISGNVLFITTGRTLGVLL